MDEEFHRLSADQNLARIRVKFLPDRVALSISSNRVPANAFIRKQDVKPGEAVFSQVIDADAL